MLRECVERLAVFFENFSDSFAVFFEIVVHVYATAWLRLFS